jgi:putative transposase
LKEIILQTVYFKPRFSLSSKDVKELLFIRDVIVNHATIQRWVYKFAPLIERALRKIKMVAGKS